MMYFKIARIAGASLDDCALLVLRSEWDDFADEDSLEWLVVRRRGSAMTIAGRGERRPRDLWMSPAGCIYFVGPHEGLNGLHRAVEAGGAFTWTRIPEVDPGDGITLPHAVWGLSDDYLFCWGGGWLEPDDLDEGEERINPALTWFFDGRSWRRIDSPGVMQSVHGADRESIFTVGEKGLVARWDGGKWVEMARPTREPLGRLHVVSADEAYAASAEGYLYEGSQYGWRDIGSGAGSVTAIAKLNGEIIIGAGMAGMCKLEGNAIVPFREHLTSYVMHVARTVMWTDGLGILETSDFSGFRRLPSTELQTLLGASYCPD